MTSPSAIRLHALNGKPAPAGIDRDLRQLERLPEPAKKELWNVLMPSLLEPVPAAVETLLDTFCARHVVEADRLALVLKACRFLLREAALLDLDPLSFAMDVAALTADSREAQALLLARFDQAKSVVRRDIGALLDHGKVLTAINWRVDKIAATDVGPQGDRLVAHLTLRYQDGDERGRITLQLTPQLLAELHQVCGAMLG